MTTLNRPDGTLMDFDGVVLAIDIGGTKMAGGLVGPDGRIQARAAVHTGPGEDPEQVWAPLAALTDRLVAAAGPLCLLGVGVGSAGPLDPRKGTVSPVNIPAWRDFPLAERLAERVPDRPVRLAGDGSCAAAGEHWRGAGRGVDNLLSIVVSTGVGGGLIQDGRLVTGPTGNAGHVGHMVVDLDGEPCPCGGRGCVEALASGPSMVRWAIRQGWQPAAARADGFAGSGGSAGPDGFAGPDGSAGRTPIPGAVDLAESARIGHPTARQAFERAAAALAAGAVSVAAACDLTHVVLGGGVARAADLLLPPLNAAIGRYARLGFLRDLTVVPSRLDADAGLVGAAALIFAAETYPAPAQSWDTVRAAAPRGDGRPDPDLP